MGKHDLKREQFNLMTFFEGYVRNYRKLNFHQLHNGPIQIILNLLKCQYPLSEQTAIAEILSDMDEEVETLAQKLNKYQAIKQGMMQELLTGKRRLV
jgi:restriction endonuclease S subunit